MLKIYKTNQELAEAYDDLHKISEIRFPIPDYETFVKLAELKKKESLILEIACGQGFLLQALKNAGFLNSIGLDLSKQALKKAKTKNNNEKLVLTKAENLPFSDQIFDFIFHLGSLEHFLDPENSLKELRRVLAAYGKAMLIVPNTYYLGTIWKVLKTGFSEDQQQEQALPRALKDWQVLIQKAGLKVTKVTKYNGFDHLIWHFNRKNPQQPSKLEKILRWFLEIFLKPLIPLVLSNSFIFIIVSDSSKE